MTEKTDEIDGARLLALFDLAGPEQAEELAMRLQDDLGAIARALGRAVEQRDSVTLRAQSHVLLAISGTVGAVVLQDLSGRLNTLSQGPGPVQAKDLVDDICRRTLRLIAQVREMRALWMART